MAVDDASAFDEAREAVNALLHRALDAEPCENACTHHVTSRWTALGVANVFGRAAKRAERQERALGRIGDSS